MGITNDRDLIFSSDSSHKFGSFLIPYLRNYRRWVFPFSVPNCCCNPARPAACRQRCRNGVLFFETQAARIGIEFIWESPQLLKPLNPGCRQRGRANGQCSNLDRVAACFSDQLVRSRSIPGSNIEIHLWLRFSQVQIEMNQIHQDLFHAPHAEEAAGLRLDRRPAYTT